jgi:hypothetical protein
MHLHMLMWNGLILYRMCRAGYRVSHVIIVLSFVLCFVIVRPCHTVPEPSHSELSSNSEEFSDKEVKEGAGDFAWLAR